MSGIREVAQLAGVSPATVSRVMNGTARVAPETQERVRSAIARTGFVPNEVARSLYKKSARTIGLIIPSIRNPFFTQLAAILDELAEQNGYRLFLCNVGQDPERERSAIQMLISLNADGIVFAAGSDELQETLLSCPIPVVAIDAKLPPGCVGASIYCDYYQGARLAMEHLLECGCQNIVCIRGPRQIFSARSRYEGYRDVCRERGIAEQTVECGYDFEAGLAMTEALLTAYSGVDGILACNDVVAVSTYKILHQKNIAVPDQIQLAGFDDIDLASLISPALTTIRQPVREMAEKAMDLIVHRRETGEADYLFPPALVERETTKRGGRR